MIRLLHNAMNSAVIVRIRFKWWFHCRHPHLKCITQRLKIEINVTLNHYVVLIASSHVCNLIVTDDTTEKIKSFTRIIHEKFYTCQLLSPPPWISKCSLVAASRMTQRSFFWLLGNKAPGSFVSWVVGFVIIPIYKELPAAGYGMSWLSFKNLHRSIKIIQGFMISRFNIRNPKLEQSNVSIFSCKHDKMCLRVCVTMKVVVRMRLRMCANIKKV